MPVLLEIGPFGLPGVREGFSVRALRLWGFGLLLFDIVERRKRNVDGGVLAGRLIGPAG